MACNEITTYKDLVPFLDQARKFHTLDTFIDFALNNFGKHFPYYPSYIGSDYIPLHILSHILAYELNDGCMTNDEVFKRFKQLRLVCKKFDQAVFLCIRTISGRMCRKFFVRLDLSKEFTLHYREVETTFQILSTKQKQLQQEICNLKHLSPAFSDIAPTISRKQRLVELIQRSVDSNEDEFEYCDDDSEDYAYVKKFSQYMENERINTVILFGDQCEKFARFFCRFKALTYLHLAENISTLRYGLLPHKDALFRVFEGAHLLSKIFVSGNGVFPLLNYLQRNKNSFPKLFHLEIQIGQATNHCDFNKFGDIHPECFQQIKKLTLTIGYSFSGDSITNFFSDLKAAYLFCFPYLEIIEFNALIHKMQTRDSEEDWEKSRTFRDHIWPMHHITTFLSRCNQQLRGQKKLKRIILTKTLVEAWHDEPTPYPHVLKNPIGYEIIDWKKDTDRFETDSVVLTNGASRIVIGSVGSFSSIFENHNSNDIEQVLSKGSTLFSSQLYDLLKELNLELEHNLNYSPSFVAESEIKNKKPHNTSDRTSL